MSISYNIVYGITILQNFDFRAPGLPDKRCAAECRTMLLTVLNKYMCLCKQISEREQLVREHLRKVLHICEHVHAFSTSRCIHSDTLDYFQRALSFASATRAKTTVCVRTQ